MTPSAQHAEGIAPGVRPAAHDDLVVLPMRDAVGYDAVDCAREASVASALILKHNRLFLLTDGRGDIAPPGHCGLGLFFDDTRCLSHYSLRFAGAPPVVLSAQTPNIYAAQIDLAINDLEFGGDPWDPRNCVHVRREVLLEDRLFETVTLTNHLTVPISFWMELAVASDFADIFEVRGWRREVRGEFYAPLADDRSIRFRYRGRDGELIESSIRFREPPGRVGTTGARWEMRLASKESVQLEWQVLGPGVTDARDPVSAPSRRDRIGPMREAYQSWHDASTSWLSDDSTFDDILFNAVDDLRALYADVDGTPVICAGIPWYSTAFGRDSIIAALQALPLNPQVAVDTLRYLARHQGVRVDPFTEEEPGKIMHELRRGEMARSGEIPHVPYYGTIDATPLWLVLLHETWRWTGDADLVRELLPTARRALEWIDRYGDVDGDHFVEYTRGSEKGLIHQGWKDSSDGVPFPDGSRPRGPIALVEVQGYVADAKSRIATLLAALGETADAARVQTEASALRDAIHAAFWLEGEGTFALALDGEKHPVPTVTSNAGHLLWSRIPSEGQAERMISVLLSPDMFSGWGIRTLSGAHPVFNPMSYHNGSVWPHDNSIVLLGMSHYGHARAALPVLSALYDACVHLPGFRLPELFCGTQRAHGLGPVRYPVSCSPQAWASGAMFMMLQGALGILPDAPARILHVRNPVLPSFLDVLTISNLRVGRSRVSLQFRRHRDRTLANLLGIDGDPLQVRIELS